MKRERIHITILILIALSLSACNTTRKTERREGKLLVKNTIKYKNPYLPYDELEGFLQQAAMPGRMAPFFRPGVFFYENSFKGKETKFRLFERKSLGTKPVIFDMNMTLSTVNKLEIYLRNKGFYHATVSDSVKYKRKTALVTYNINSGPPCIVNSFVYNIPDSIMRSYIMSDTANGKLREGMIYDTYVLDDDRDRIATLLRNNSYFDFSQSDIYYTVDTSGAGLAANVVLQIKKQKVNLQGSPESLMEITHQRYFLKNIYINPDADITQQLIPHDTLTFHYHRNKSDTVGSAVYILYNKKLTLKPSFLSSSLNFASGDPYSQASANRTYKKLISQGIISSANISMIRHQPETFHPADTQWLDCNIRLIRNNLNTFSLGTEGTNAGGRLGMGVNTSIQNRNLFRGAEVLSLKLKTSAELQGSLSTSSQDGDKYLYIFSTLEGSAEVSIDFPRLVIPYRSLYQAYNRQGRTSLSAGIGYEQRPLYSRSISTSAWSYKWNKNEQISFVFTPLELNYIKIFPSDSFNTYLASLSDPQYKSQFSDHLLTMVRFSVIVSNMGISKQSNQFFFRLNAETSGNSFYMIDNLSNKEVPAEGYYQRLNVRYSQYVRTDFDFRKFWKLRYDNTLAFRFMGGVAQPYGNSVSMPFEKSFWLGGANDMRGWRIRSLGPGGYADPDIRYDKTGDIMLQSSIEQRFPIYSFLLGSLFVDAGNIWLRKESEDFPDGAFKLNTFYKQIAVDAGIGFRFDFSFFIFRIDAAVPVHNPARTTAWFNSEDFRFRKAIWNFGIGYPF